MSTDNLTQSQLQRRLLMKFYEERDATLNEQIAHANHNLAMLMRESALNTNRMTQLVNVSQHQQNRIHVDLPLPPLPQQRQQVPTYPENTHGMVFDIPVASLSNPNMMGEQFARLFQDFMRTEEGLGGNVGLTPEQIARSTICANYDDIDGAVQTICSITQEVFEPNTRVMQINRCKHIYCETALREWFANHSTCPDCRYNLLENNSSARPTHQTMSQQRVFTMNL